MPRTKRAADIPESGPEREAFLARLDALSTKVVESTPPLDFDMIDGLGVRADFDALTGRVGLTTEFWQIPSHYPRAIADATREFLASVKLVEDSQGDHYVEFQLEGILRSVRLADMREWFHLPEPDTPYLGFGPETEDGDLGSRYEFWHCITLERLPDRRPDPRLNAIIHPCLRL